jgi:hypothetical protein
MFLQELIKSVGAPFIVQFDSMATSLNKRLQMLGIIPCVVDIGLARNKADLFEIFRVAMQMPYQQITNWDALEETLADLSWLQPTSIDIILSGAEIFSTRDPQAFHELISLLEAVGKEWAKPVTDEDWWDRNAIPFHVYVPKAPNKRSRFTFPDLPD